MWNRREIETHVAFLDKHEALVLEATAVGHTDFTAVFEYVASQFPNADPAYVKALYNILHRKEVIHAVGED